MAKQIPVGKVLPLSIDGFKDAAGHDTVIDTVQGWGVSDETKCHIVTNAAGLPCVGPDPSSPDAVGDGQQVFADVDVRVGPEVRTVRFFADFDVPAGEAASATITLGELEDHP